MAIVFSGSPSSSSTTVFKNTSLLVLRSTVSVPPSLLLFSHATGALCQKDVKSAALFSPFGSPGYGTPALLTAYTKLSFKGFFFSQAH